MKKRQSPDFRSPEVGISAAGYSQFENKSNIISMQLNTFFMTFIRSRLLK